MTYYFISIIVEKIIILNAVCVCEDVWKQGLLYISGGNNLNTCNKSEGAQTLTHNSPRSMHMLKGKCHSHVQTHMEYTQIHYILSLKGNISKFYKVE